MGPALLGFSTDPLHQQRLQMNGGPANFSLQRTAGLRFSQFVAQWPAAAEFRCWAANMERP